MSPLQTHHAIYSRSGGTIMANKKKPEKVYVWTKKSDGIFKKIKAGKQLISQPLPLWIKNGWVEEKKEED